MFIVRFRSQSFIAYTTFDLIGFLLGEVKLKESDIIEEPLKILGISIKYGENLFDNFTIIAS